MPVGYDIGDSRRLLSKLYRAITPRYGCREDDAALVAYRQALAKVKTFDFGVCAVHSLYLSLDQWDVWVY
jgi:hypothetical protein